MLLYAFLLMGIFKIIALGIKRYWFKSLNLAENTLSTNTIKG